MSSKRLFVILMFALLCILSFVNVSNALPCVNKSASINSRSQTREKGLQALLKRYMKSEGHIVGLRHETQTSNENVKKSPFNENVPAHFKDDFKDHKRRKRSLNYTRGGVNPPDFIIPPEILQQHPDLFSEIDGRDTAEDFRHILNTIKSQHQDDDEERAADPMSRMTPPENEQASSLHENLTGQETHEIPQYMLDLFDKFENDPLAQPASNIVRSFFNEATAEDQQTYHDNYIACTEEFDSCPRIHHLMFDVTSVPGHERVTVAELRLYKIVERDRRKYIGLDRKVDVVEILRTEVTNPSSNETTIRLHRNVLDSRRIIGRSSGWETFVITPAIRRWVRSEAPAIHELEVYIENISMETNENTVEFEQTPKTTNEPLLVVFSDEKSKRHRLERQEELQELLSHGGGEALESDSSAEYTDDAGIFHQRLTSHLESTGAPLSRKKRSAHEPCHYESMYVNFREIGYDSWILSPRGYPAGRCVGTCDIPFHGTDVSPHAVIQNWMHRSRSSEYDRPCCVPVKLGPVSLLYFEKNAVALKYNYEGMKVLKCGCR